MGLWRGKPAVRSGGVSIRAPLSAGFSRPWRGRQCIRVTLKATPSCAFPGRRLLLQGERERERGSCSAVAIELTRKRAVRARPLPQAGGFLTLALARRFSGLGVREALKWERGPCRRRRTSGVTDASRLAATHPCATPTSPSSVTNAQESRLPPGAGPQGRDEGPVAGGPKGKEPPKQASIRVMKG